MKRPSKLSLASLPTPLHKLEKISERLNKEVYIKRDDSTGMLVSGNKIRKLEYVLYDAVRNNADAVVTCGGIQSNHVRATLISATLLGLKPFAVLRGEEPDVFDGNTLLTAMTGAEISYVTEDEYDSIEDVYGRMDHDLRKRGLNPYFIPEGASDELGSWGYISMMEELKKQQEDREVRFDSLFVAVGSGGTQAGILLGKYLTDNGVSVTGINVFKKTRDLHTSVTQICTDAIGRFELPVQLNESDVVINDDYIGTGYARSTDAEIRFYLEVARTEGIILDPVYTGKAFLGMEDLLTRYPDRYGKNILFLHTGGNFALYPERERISRLIRNEN